MDQKQLSREFGAKKGADTEKILVVDQEQKRAERYIEWLQEYEVSVAENDREAREELEEDGASVILADGSTTELPRESPLDDVRNINPGIRIALIDDEEPLIDVIQLGFDALLVKPVSREEVVKTVEKLIMQSSYHEQLDELYHTAAKKAMIETTKQDVKEDEDYAEIDSQLREIRQEMDKTVEEFDEDDFVATFYDLSED